MIPANDVPVIVPPVIVACHVLVMTSPLLVAFTMEEAMAMPVDWSTTIPMPTLLTVVDAIVTEEQL
jgi:hypothetical protein